MGHFRGFHESGRIPVAEAGGRVEFHDGAAQPGVAFRQPVHQRERGDSVDGAAGLHLQPRAVQLILHRGHGQQAVALFFEVAENPLGEGVFADRLADPVKVGIGQDQSGVVGPDQAQKIVVACLWRSNCRETGNGLPEAGKTCDLAEQYPACDDAPHCR